MSIQAKGIPYVNVVDFPSRVMYLQAAYADCYRTNKDAYDWILFMPPTEWVAFTQAGTIPEYMERNPDFQKYEVIRLGSVIFSNFNRLAKDLKL